MFSQVCWPWQNKHSLHKLFLLFHLSLTRSPSLPRLGHGQTHPEHLITSGDVRSLSDRRSASPSQHHSSMLFLSFDFPSPLVFLLVPLVDSSFLNIIIPLGSVQDYLLCSLYTLHSHGFKSRSYVNA